jgi:MFS family permease
LGILLMANLGLMAGYGSFITTYAPYAQDSMGWTTAEIGILFSLFGLGSITVGPAVGAAADRYGRRQVGALSTIPVFAFSLALILAAPSLLLYAIAVAAGGGLAGFNACWFALLMTATGGPRGGRAFGTVSALSNLGIVLGAIVAARLWETVDIRAGMLMMLVAIAFAGFALAAYPEGRPAGRVETEA